MCLRNMLYINDSVVFVIVLCTILYIGMLMYKDESPITFAIKIMNNN